MNECQQFWSSIDSKSREEGNRPDDYYKKDTSIIEVLTCNWEIPKDASIFELGTNVGTNLNQLLNRGYNNLSGVEINPHALELQKKVYPKLDGLIVNSSIEDFVTNCKQQFDCVFSMAVLMHIPHESNFIYPHIARMAKNTIVTLEHEGAEMEFIYARDYKRIFESLGFTNTHTGMLSSENHPELYNYNDFTYRVFKRNG